jgi:uncharacterized SAM-binding protein YcdF (DUF218 family)
MVAEQLTRWRERARGALEGALLGVVIWCMVYVLRVLPGRTADDIGVIAFLVIGAALGLTRFGRQLRIVLAATAVLVALVTLTGWSDSLSRRWIRADPPPATRSDAIVVLSASLRSDSTIDAEATGRLLTALELARAGRANVIVTTTLERKFPAGMLSSAGDQGRLIALVGDSLRWIPIPAGKTTHDEAQSAAQRLLPEGKRHITLVTSPMHTRRACAVFEAVGFVVSCVPAKTRTPGSNGAGAWPRDRLADFGDWVYEVFAVAKYRMRGWLTPVASTPH